MRNWDPTRRALLGGLGAAATVGLAAGARAQSAPPSPPPSPLTLNIVDAAGNLALTQRGFEAYRRKNPKLVGRFAFSQAPSPELPGKIKAQQDAGHVDIDMVLIGTDALSAGIVGGLWEPILPAHQSQLPDLQQVLLPGAAKMQALAQNQGVIVVFCPAGPIFEYLPDKVTNVPKTAQDVLDWSRQNKNKFMYARPANSGPGRAFLMGLPYILGDKDPKDPKNGWAKSWSYLAALGENIEYYPSGTGAVMQEFGEGTRTMIASHTGWDINPRVLGTVPKEAKVFAVDGTHWVNDAHYMVIPKKVPAERLPILIDLMAFMLTKPAQAFTYDKGYFYPGPAVAGVTLDMAPQDSQDAIKEFGRPEYAKWIADFPNEQPLDAENMVYAFQRWDQQVGSKRKT
jgi:putative spermidine/putrescine transport system substrate-binding protein